MAGAPADAPEDDHRRPGLNEEGPPAYGAAVPTYVMTGPFPPPYPALRLRRKKMKPDKASHARVLRAQEQAIERWALEAEGLTLDEAHALAGSRPQARALLPLNFDKVFVADGWAPENEEGAVRVRHYPDGNWEIPPEESVRLTAIATALATELADRFVRQHGTWGQIFQDEWWPTSWTKEKAEHAFEELAEVKLQDLAGRVFTRQMFVKMNESLTKRKARLIVAMDESLALLQAITVRTIGMALFHQNSFEFFSIKHCSLEELDVRMAEVSRPFVQGVCLSADFGSWDSTIQKPLRKATEIAFCEAFYRRLTTTDPWVQAAMKDRAREDLVAQGRWWDLRAQQHGRQSGDGGTSTLNYIVNLVMSVSLECKLYRACREPTDIAQILGRRLSRTSWFTSVHEGDDTVLFYSKQLVRRLGRQQLARITEEHYASLHLNLEPAFEGGVTHDPQQMLRSPGERFEFVSRLFAVTATPPFSIPKLPKTIRSAAVTFSKEPLNNVAFSAGVSGMYTCASHPLLVHVYAIVHNLGKAGDGKWSPGTYREREVDRVLKSTTLEAYLNHASFNHGTARKILARETGLTERRLLQIEDELESFARGHIDWLRLSEILDLLA